MEKKGKNYEAVEKMMEFRRLFCQKQDGAFNCKKCPFKFDGTYCLIQKFFKTFGTKEQIERVRSERYDEFHPDIY